MPSVEAAIECLITEIEEEPINPDDVNPAIRDEYEQRLQEIDRRARVAWRVGLTTFGLLLLAVVGGGVSFIIWRVTDVSMFLGTSPFWIELITLFGLLDVLVVLFLMCVAGAAMVWHFSLSQARSLARELKNLAYRDHAHSETWRAFQEWHPNGSSYVSRILSPL